MNYRNTPLTHDEKEKIKEIYLKIGNQRTVAKETGHSCRTVNNVLKDYGLNKGQGGNQLSQTKITNKDLVDAAGDLSVKEMSLKFGVHENTIYRRLRKLEIKLPNSDQLLGLRKQWGKHNENLKNKDAKFGECWHYVSSFDEKCKKIHPEFIYIETRRINDSNITRVRLKCKLCNTIIERAESTVRQKNLECDCCRRNKQLQDERAKLIYFLIALKDYKTPKECKYCEKEFYSKYPNSRYCSSKCKRKAKGGSIKARCKKYGVFYDPSVTPAKIFARDDYVCKICGQKCVKDKAWTEYMGPKSPTVDHIVALANGGNHVWSNVQCAHAICNSYKRNLTIV